jgi:GR25 family glycosyltransferase involved in LPS biosynthesis
MLAHDKPIVSGVYRQRLEPQMIELYDLNMRRMDVSQLTGTLQEIGGCGFGCVLVKKEVFSAIQYPWFFYHQALNHNHTFSEDLDFCKKVLERGFKIYADSSILCKHIGQKIFEIELPEIQSKQHNNKPNKAIIIYNENEISKKYLKTAADSCSALGIHSLHFKGYENQTTNDLEKEFGFKFGSDKFPMNNAVGCCSASHFRVWEYIATQHEPYIILEHDALLLHRVDLEIPNDTIVALGYKTHDPSKYDHVKAGSPNKILNINRHSGSHAYVITPNTAKKLLEELKIVGAERAIDNYYFMRKNDPDDTESSIKLALVNPIAALAWVRKSTIWEHVNPITSGYDITNYDLIESFLTNYAD